MPRVKGHRFKKRTKADIVLTVLIIVFSVAAVVSGGFLLYDFVIADMLDRSSVNSLIEEVDVTLEADSNTDEDTDDGKVYSETPAEIIRIGVDELDLSTVSFLEYNTEKLASTAPNAVGWFRFSGPNSVNGLPISNPIMQGSNNDFYLSHDYSGASNVNGAIFADSDANVETLSKNRNTVIYGHARSTQKFGGLKYLNEAEAWYANAYNHLIYITTPTEKTVWQVFSWYETTADADYRRMAFSSSESYLDYINMLQSRNAIPALKKFDFTADNRIITLSTCKGTDGNKRVAVHAVLVKKG